MTCSIIERKPRAPVSLSIAWLAIAFNAPGVNSKATSSSDNNFLYCFVKAFLG